MITNPVLLAALLFLIQIFVLQFSSKNPKYFEVFPPVFWIYFIPMLASTAGILPTESVLYPLVSKYVLPVSLFLLLIGVDLPAIVKLGKTALLMMFAGSAGIILGAPIVILLFKQWLAPDSWLGFVALSGSWTGGSANMVAVKEALSIPDSAFLPMVIVDVVVAYSWMAILIWLRSYETKFNKKVRADKKLVQELKQKTVDLKSLKAKDSFGREMLIFLAILITFLSVGFSKSIPVVQGFSSSTWVILIVSTIALFLSFTPLQKLDSKGASNAGYFLLYFVLTSIGAKANLSHIFSAPILILAGFTWVLIHFLFLLMAARLLKAPLSLVATASQANIGGPVSAPIVAAVYHPRLAPVGLLLGILGNVLGTYFGLLCFQLCVLLK